MAAASAACRLHQCDLCRCIHASARVRAACSSTVKAKVCELIRCNRARRTARQPWWQASPSPRRGRAVRPTTPPHTPPPHTHTPPPPHPPPTATHRHPPTAVPRTHLPPGPAHAEAGVRASPATRRRRRPPPHAHAAAAFVATSLASHPFSIAPRHPRRLRGGEEGRGGGCGTPLAHPPHPPWRPPAP